MILILKMCNSKVSFQHILKKALALSSPRVFLAMGYHGVTFDVDSLSGSIHLNYFLNCIADLLSCVVPVLALPLMGRRASLSASLILGGAACLCTLIPELALKSGKLNEL